VSAAKPRPEDYDSVWTGIFVGLGLCYLTQRLVLAADTEPEMHLPLGLYLALVPVLFNLFALALYISTLWRHLALGLAAGAWLADIAFVATLLYKLATALADG
jgi:hypothetical protein